MGFPGGRPGYHVNMKPFHSSNHVLEPVSTSMSLWHIRSLTGELVASLDLPYLVIVKRVPLLCKAHVPHVACQVRGPWFPAL
jgi:hypothetical protein